MMSNSRARFALICLWGALLVSSPASAEAINEALIPMTLTVASYAHVEERSGFHFGSLSGERGIYHLAPNSLRELFVSLLKLNWGFDWLEFLQDDDELATLARLIITSNVPADVEFQFHPGASWLPGPTLFGVWSDDEFRAQYFGSRTPPVASRVVVTKPTGPTTFTLGGAILIEDVDAVEAGDYSAEILVTISAQG